MCLFNPTQHFNGSYDQRLESMALVNPNKANVLINFRSDDPNIQTDVLIPEYVTFQFNRQIKIPPTMKAQISVLSAQIPNTQYTFDNDITLIYKIDASVVLTVVLPKGHYSICTFRKKMQAIIDGNGVTTNLLPGWMTVGSFDESLGKFALKTVTGNDSVWSLETSGATIEEDKMLARMIGQRTFSTLFPIYSIEGGVWNSVDVVDTTRSHNFYICSNTLSPSSVDSSNQGAEWVLAKIAVNAPYLSMVNYDGNQRVGCLHESEFLDRVNISIRNHDNELIKLNGVRWNLALLIEFIDRVPPTVYQRRSVDRRLAGSNDQRRDMLGKTAELPPPADQVAPAPRPVPDVTERYKKWYAKQTKKTKKAITRALRSQKTAPNT